MINLITTIILVLMLGTMFIFTAIDLKKKRTNNYHPLITFIVPCYNAEKSVEETINSIYECYDNIQLITIDDKSKDNTLEILKELQKRYKFSIIENLENKGKAKSINDVSILADGEIIFVVDSDVTLTKEGIKDILRRFSNDNNVVAISCSYRPKNKGFLAEMQEFEYNYLSLIQFSYNYKSTLSLWGGSFAVRKKEFFEVGRLSENAITEDMDLALKLFKKGYKVEQSIYHIYTNVPTKLKSWVKQKIRWTSGGMQCFLTYPKLFFKNYLYLLFVISYGILASIFFYSMLSSFIALFNHTWHYSLSNLYMKSFFMIFSLPFVVISITSIKKLYKLLYLIPFSFIYTPIFLIVSLFGFSIGIYKYFKLKDGGRAW